MCSLLLCVLAKYSNNDDDDGDVNTICCWSHNKYFEEDLGIRAVKVGFV